MAEPTYKIPVSVFLPGTMVLSQQDINYQLAHAGDFNAVGLNTFTIALMIIVSVAVALRLYSRKIAKIDWKSDDYTLIAGWALSMGAQAMSLNITYNGGFGRHTYANLQNEARFEQFGKSAYAWNVLYTTSYPVSRISLVLLYRRVFIQRWVNNVCWFLIFCYAGYAIGSMVADLCASFPIASNWDPDITATKIIDGRALFLGNSGFNIATDFILLVLPLIVIWSIKTTWRHKLGLSFIFSLGVLTVIASVARLVCYYQYNKNDAMWGLPTSQFWTISEMNLGLLCPCLVTFGPLIRRTYRHLRRVLNSKHRARADRFTGYASTTDHEQNKPSFGNPEGGHSTESSTKINESHEEDHHHNHPGQLEAGLYSGDGSSEDDSLPHEGGYKEDGDAGMVGQAVTTEGPTKAFVGREAFRGSGDRERDAHGMALDQDVALANLDPRTRAYSGSRQGEGKRLGFSSSAVADEQRSDVPDRGIGVTRDWRLESE